MSSKPVGDGVRAVATSWNLGGMEGRHARRAGLSGRNPDAAPRGMPGSDDIPSSPDRYGFTASDDISGKIDLPCITPASFEISSLLSAVMPPAELRRPVIAVMPNYKFRPGHVCATGVQHIGRKAKPVFQRIRAVGPLSCSTV